MPQNVTLYRVLVASPADCDAERKLVPEVIHYWNATHTRSTGAILEPVLWETHSTPEMGDRPQGIINKQLCNMCDLLVGTFWTRLGTNTGVAESGTAEEIEEFRKAGKPVLLYFSQQPAVLDTVDHDQLKALNDYKKRLQAQGLLATYASLGQVRADLTRHLTATVGRLHASPTGTTPAPTGEADAAIHSVRTFKSNFEAFLRRFESEWASERDSDPHGIREGQSIARVYFDELIQFRSQIEIDKSGISPIIEEALKRLRGIQRWQLVMDGGISFRRFWQEGDTVIESLKRVPDILQRVLTETTNTSPGGGARSNS